MLTVILAILGVMLSLFIFISLMGTGIENVFVNVHEAPERNSFWWVLCYLGFVSLKSDYAMFTYCQGCKRPAGARRWYYEPPKVCPQCGCDFKTTPPKKATGRCIRKGKCYRIELAKQPELLSNEGIKPRYR